MPISTTVFGNAPIIDLRETLGYVSLPEGRFWSIADASFVESVPSGMPVASYPVFDENASPEENLASYLRRAGHPLGSLASDADYASEAREKRNALVAETDYLMMPDYPLSETKRAAFVAYRQALRDVPAQSGFPRQIDWPVKP